MVKKGNNMNNKIYVGIEPLVSISFLRGLSSGKNLNFVSYKDIKKLGIDIQNKLKEKDIDVVLILRNDEVMDFYRNMNDIFEESLDGDILGIRLKEGFKNSTTIDRLEENIPISLSLNYSI